MPLGMGWAPAPEDLRTGGPVVPGVGLVLECLRSMFVLGGGEYGRGGSGLFRARRPSWVYSSVSQS